MCETFWYEREWQTDSGLVLRKWERESFMRMILDKRNSRLWGGVVMSVIKDPRTIPLITFKRLTFLFFPAWFYTTYAFNHQSPIATKPPSPRILPPSRFLFANFRDFIVVHFLDSIHFLEANSLLFRDNSLDPSLFLGSGPKGPMSCRTQVNMKLLNSQIPI